MWDAFPPVYRDNMRYALGAADADDARARAAGFTLAGSRRPECPALILHGGRDRIFPPSEAEAQADWAGRGSALEVFPDGNHVCNNIPWLYRPMVADWVADGWADRDDAAPEWRPACKRSYKRLHDGHRTLLGPRSPPRRRPTRGSAKSRKRRMADAP